MTLQHRRYILIETSISIAFSVALSLVAALLLFGTEGNVQVGGAGGLVIDSVPQSFMISLMVILVPGWLTRRRVAAGTVASLSPRRGVLPHNLLLRALCVAACVAIIVGLLHAALSPWMGPSAWPLARVLIYKAIHGALLAAIVTATMLRYELRQPTR